MFTKRLLLSQHPDGTYLQTWLCQRWPLCGGRHYKLAVDAVSMRPTAACWAVAGVDGAIHRMTGRVKWKNADSCTAAKRAMPNSRRLSLPQIHYSCGGASLAGRHTGQTRTAGKLLSPITGAGHSAWYPVIAFPSTQHGRLQLPKDQACFIAIDTVTALLQTTPAIDHVPFASTPTVAVRTGAGQAWRVTQWAV